MVNTLPTKFPPVGRCIYCLRSSGPLSDEHIIAYGLNGTAVLPDASCPACAEVTSELERRFLRGPAYAMRGHFGFKSRKGLPNKFPVYVTKNGVSKKLNLRVDQYPLVLPLPIFSNMVPAYMENRVADTIKAEKTVLISLIPGVGPGDLLVRAKKFLNVDSLELPTLDVMSFGRMILKSAYALTVATHGLDSVKDPIAVPVILERKHDLGTFLGSTPDVSHDQEGEHITRVQKFARPGEEVAVVMIKLFGTLPAPIYVAVTARMK